MNAQVLLPQMLGMAVPLHILQIKKRGGPTEEDRKRASETQELLGEHGDCLFFPPKKKKDAGTTADMFNRTAHVIAVLSFSPSGVTLFGSHFDAKDWPPQQTVAPSARAQQ